MCDVLSSKQFERRQALLKDSELLKILPFFKRKEALSLKPQNPFLQL
jgi:hypothetical protein